MKRKILFVMLVFSLISLFTSVLIMLENKSESNALHEVCTATGSNCNAVQNSEYGKVFGVKMVHAGLAAFLIFTLLILSQIFGHKVKLKGKINIEQLRYLMIAGAVIAGLSGIYLISLQAFVLHQYCVYCLVIDSSSIILMTLAIFYLILHRKEKLQSRK